MSRRQEQLLLFAAFREAGVEYAVVGGVAVNAHGFHRNTRDLDIFIRPTEQNALRAYEALKSLGAPLDDSEPSDLLMDYSHFQLHSPHGSIDILPSIGDMPFDTVWRNRVEAVVEGVLIPFISKVDLIENKRQIARHIDLADVDELTRLPDTDVLKLPED